MDKPVKAEVLVEHRNAYPPQELKAVGDSYTLPEGQFLGLEALGLVKRKGAKAKPAAAEEQDPPVLDPPA